MISKLKASNYKLYKFTLSYFILTIIACIFISIRIVYKGNLRYAFLIWNIFLTWIPYYLSIIFTYHAFKSRLLKYITGFVWLLFYPNAPYMITDFIHLSAYNFYTSTQNNFAFNSSFSDWYDFFLISIFVILGLILSFCSLKLMHKRIKECFSYIISWLFVLIVSVLSGYAIYLGRFIRVNSWELVTNPLYLFHVLMENINFNGFIFTLLFGGLSFFIYFALYISNKFLSDND